MVSRSSGLSTVNYFSVHVAHIHTVGTQNLRQLHDLQNLDCTALVVTGRRIASVKCSNVTMITK